MCGKIYSEVVIEPIYTSGEIYPREENNMSKIGKYTL